MIVFYWSRTGNPLDVALGLTLCALWALGGWLIATRAFRLRPPERLPAGLALGLLLFITLANLLAPWLPLTAAFWAAAVGLAVGGLALAWRDRSVWARHWRRDLRGWPWLVALGLLTALFTLVLRGLAIFDDYVHLPLISVMATGDVPPHFYLDPQRYFAYHYALQVFAAALVRVGGLFPWSAWDLSRALALALTTLLGWIWIRRLTRSHLAAGLGSALLVFGGGARWLLLMVPPAWLAAWSTHLDLQPTWRAAGPDLASGLAAAWPMEGGGPFPFPLAFGNAIFPPLNIQLGSTGALPAMTVLLILLLVGRGRLNAARAAILGLLLANLALSAEHLYVAVAAGVALAAAIAWLRSGRGGRTHPAWIGALALSLVLAGVQGGFLTEATRQALSRMTGGALTATANLQGFSLRWPPGLVSGHLGPLSVLDGPQLSVLLAELGPILLLAPAVTVFGFGRLRRRELLLPGLVLAALICFLFPMFFRYGVDRYITRLPATSLWLWCLLGFPLVWLAWPRLRLAVRWLAAGAYVVALAGGLVLFAVELIAIPRPTLSYFIQYGDAKLSRAYWNRLGPSSQILDSEPERAVTVFGRASLAREDIFSPLASWKALVANPAPSAVARAGYDYLYVDEVWWLAMSPSQRQALSEACVRLVERLPFGDGSTRRLFDVRACR